MEKLEIKNKSIEEQYAQKHYLEDTGMGIQIKPFLDAITSEKENGFLELINSWGV